MSRHQRLQRTMRSPARRHRRRRYVPPAEREQAYKGRQMPASELHAMFGGAPKRKITDAQPLPRSWKPPEVKGKSSSNTAIRWARGVLGFRRSGER